MQVFKAYFKIIKKNIPMLSLYMIIFLSVVVGITLSNRPGEISDFTQSKSSLAIVNEDSGSALSEGLIAYIAENANIIDLGEGEGAFKDALFYEKIAFVLKIPKGFSDDFMNGKAVSLEETKGINKTAGMYTEMLINSFLNTARLYALNANNMTQSEVVQSTTKDLSIDTKVTMRRYDKGMPQGEIISFFFNYASYSTIVILIFGVSTFMMVFNRSVIKLRTLCSPLSQTQVVFQSLLADFCFAMVVWAITMICGFILYGSELFSLNGVLWGLNLFIFSMVSLAISFLIGSIIKSKKSIPAIGNTIGLGFSFLCGAFVPQYLLGDGVLAVAKFIPTYWYIRANNLIGNLNSISSEQIGPIMICYSIQVGFFAAIIAISLVINKQRLVESVA